MFHPGPARSTSSLPHAGEPQHHQPTATRDVGPRLASGRSPRNRETPFRSVERMSCLRSSPSIGREHPGGERVAGNAISRPVTVPARSLSLRLTGNSYCSWEQRRSRPVSGNADPAAGYYRSVARGCRGSYSPTSPPPGRCRLVRRPHRASVTAVSVAPLAPSSSIVVSRSSHIR